MLDDFLNIRFSKMQNYSYINISNDDERDIVHRHNQKIKALHNNDEAEFYQLCKLEKESEFHGYYSITENDKIMILDMYQRIIKGILKEMVLSSEKFL